MNELKYALWLAEEFPTIDALAAEIKAMDTEKRDLIDEVEELRDRIEELKTLKREAQIILIARYEEKRRA